MSFSSPEQALTPPLPVNGSGLSQRFSGQFLSIAPGVAYMGAIAASAFLLRQLPFVGALSPMILAIVISIGIQNLVGTPAWAKPGAKFCLQRLLRLGVALLGLQLTFAQVIAMGGMGVAIIVATMFATFMFTTWLGRVLGVDQKLTTLIAGGTSVCGASAVIATNAVAGASDEDVSYAVASVTVFGSIAMCVYPLLPAVLNLSPHAFGLWAGASIHEVAQVVAAAFQDGPEAGQFGTVAKLSRVLMLAPMIGLLCYAAARRMTQCAADPAQQQAAGKPAFPWFVAGFLALVALNSVIAVPDSARPTTTGLTQFLLSTGLAAMGAQTDILKLRAKGLRPALLAALSSAFIALFSLALIKLAM